MDPVWRQHGRPLPGGDSREGARCEQREDAGSEGDAAYREIREEPKRPRTKRCDADRPAPLSPGCPAPDFTLPDQNGHPVRLADLRGKRLVLFFYPRAGTEGCTLEVQQFRDAYPMFQRLGVAVVGASPDTVPAQKQFAEKEHLPFPLLADHRQDLAQRYGVLREKTMFGHKFMGVVRSTFLIAADGRIERVFSRVRPDGHAAAVLQAVCEADGAAAGLQSPSPARKKPQRR